MMERVQQQIYISVDEEGTTAASLTETEMVAVGGPPHQPEHPRVEKFYVDRPFIFFLTEEVSGLLLMAGVIHEPTD